MYLLCKICSTQRNRISTTQRNLQWVSFSAKYGLIDYWDRMNFCHTSRFPRDPRFLYAFVSFLPVVAANLLCKMSQIQFSNVEIAPKLIFEVYLSYSLSIFWPFTELCTSAPNVRMYIKLFSALTKKMITYHRKMSYAYWVSNIQNTVNR